MKMCVLNHEQTKLIEDHHQLIYWMIQQKHLEIDEWYDVFAIALCNSALHYDKTKNIKFITYACTALKHAYCEEIARLVRNKDTLSYYEFEDKSDDVSLEEEVIDRISFYQSYNKVYNTLTVREKQIADMIATKCTYDRITSTLKCSRKSVSKIKNMLYEGMTA